MIEKLTDKNPVSESIIKLVNEQKMTIDTNNENVTDVRVSDANYLFAKMK